MQLYNIILKNTGNGATIYNENLPFLEEPTIDHIIAVVTFVRPSTTGKYDWIDWSYVCELDKETGKPIPNKTKTT